MSMDMGGVDGVGKVEGGMVEPWTDGGTGTQMQPLFRGDDPGVVADWLLKSWKTARGGKGLLVMGGTWFRWDGKKWVEVGVMEVEDEVVKLVQGLWVWSEGGKRKQLTVKRGLVGDVMRAVEAKVRVREEAAPFWIGGGQGKPDPKTLVSVEDWVYDVAESARVGMLVGFERDETLMEPNVLGVTKAEVEGGGRAVRWERALVEWGGEHPAWAERFERFLGYACMGKRGYSRGLLQAGVVRGGKGTSVRFLKRVMGKGMVKERDLKAFSGEFGMSGLSGARVLVITEMNDLATADGQVAGSRLKSIWGEDPVFVNRKNVRVETSEVLRVAVLMQSNQMPKLPDQGEGLSSKMLVLPYSRSYLNKEEFDLEERLWEERGPIVRRWLEAAMRLEMEKSPEAKWPKPEGSQEVMERFLTKNSPVQQFLKDEFKQVEGGRVETEAVRTRWREWCEKKELSPMPLAPNAVVAKILEEGMWGLKRFRSSETGTRYLMGMVMQWAEGTAGKREAKAGV